MSSDVNEVLPSTSEIKETFEFLDSWEDRYGYVIELGRAIPKLPTEHRIEQNLVRGCQSLVWLVTRFDSTKQTMQFELDSDAHIVRGLIAIVLSNVQDTTPQEITTVDLDLLFEELDLIKHLSPTRGNGLRAMIQRIKLEASRYVD